jgi:arylsulfatase
MPDELKPVLARQMELYAGFLEQTDHEVGRVIDAIDGLGILGDTLVYYILGDNGASAEGTINGCFNEMTTLNGMPGIETTEFLLSKIDDFGTPEAYNHYAVGWAHAMCTPYQWAKQVASHWGGTRNGTIVHWPNGIEDKGKVRNQFHHVIDVVPTILEAAGIPAPQSVNGTQQAALEGVSMMPSLSAATSADNHDLQYFEMMGNRGIYHQGWTAVTKHRTPWIAAAPPAFDDDVWDCTRQTTGPRPTTFRPSSPRNLLSCNGYGSSRRSSTTWCRSTIGASSGSTPTLPAEACVLTLKNKSHSVTANIEVPESGATGVIITQGGSVGGWTLYAYEGRLKYCYNFFGIEYYMVTADAPIPAGKHQVRMEFAYDGGGLAKGGTVTLYYDGKPVGTGRVDQTQPMGYSADEACDVGADTGSPASPDYGPTGNKFSGDIEWVQIDIGDDSHDHLITAEDRFNIAMAHQ